MSEVAYSLPGPLRVPQCGKARQREANSLKIVYDPFYRIHHKEIITCDSKQNYGIFMAVYNMEKGQPKNHKWEHRNLSYSLLRGLVTCTNIGYLLVTEKKTTYNRNRQYSSVLVIMIL